MIKEMRLKNFRSFQNFTIKFSGSACLVGPNNAGKSTILTAIRLADSLLATAWARKADLKVIDGMGSSKGYLVSFAEFPTLKESLRHEFHTELEVRLELLWENGNKLVAIWPAVEHDDSDESAGAFYLMSGARKRPMSVADVRANFPRLGIIPILNPTEHTEMLLTTDYVRRNQASRLSSRHFRNQLYQLREAGELEDFKQFASPWLPEITITDIDKHEAGRDTALDVFLAEVGSKIPKELNWAGDGVQVWLQILYHIYRLRDRATVVLDEPDVYLHADLQRRLVQLLETVHGQTIIATHSAEIISEMPQSSILWIERGKRAAKSIRDESLLEKLSSSLGSQFNLRLAKAMRSKVILMVEGRDMRILRRLCRTIGANRLAMEDGVSIITLGGYSKINLVEPFQWVVKEFLDNSVECFLILDSDYRSTSMSTKIEKDFRAVGIDCHVWRRKELESYLLSVDAMARVSGANPQEVQKILDNEIASLQNDVFARMLDERVREQKSAHQHQVSVTKLFKPEFDALWGDPKNRVGVVPPKELISKINSQLQAKKHKAISMERLAGALQEYEIPTEMRAALLKVEEAVRSVQRY
ncbi:AAA family ATPase [Nocardia sp. NPDC004168]|uniref:ATP-dependent nuclease n=1 Tax=Nocardia sp. NPDC004168 TaxID=3154452 RepID=UPI00339EC075